ncbi:chromate transporter [Mycoplasmopsis agassizii]|uniref:Uncharacterized protein n=1 Tax=Mycoplasmopsis agassizii TaxID=33922 RepID=A0A1W1X882_9BACT|nr:chromate transporter [Mycoplasmopsis agassizii]PAF54748.1 hypothetical protein CJF60_03355 [Mycoplasmopsis agassizii]PAK21498.1 hypothetical protein CJJ23_01760 [Mycoplasmopsis agassizii]SMC20073.1 Chromate transporter [Mycoplasmopsis agassizii]
MFIALLVSLPYTVFVSLVVFGGGQVFMPMFQNMWNFLASTFNIPIDPETINNIFVVGNLTPGVFSTQLSIFTGILISQGQWWGYLAMFLTYAVFVLPATIIMIISMAIVKKIEHNRFLVLSIKYMKPVIAGIIIALVIQLLIGLLLPFVSFNKSIDQYIVYKDPSNLNSDASFFVGWRLYVLPVYLILAIGGSLLISGKYKKHLLISIFYSLALAFLFFQPWLA